MSDQNGDAESRKTIDIDIPPSTDRAEKWAQSAEAGMPGGTFDASSLMYNSAVSIAPSSFAREFLGFTGRVPTAEETRRHLEYDRLAKSSALDPMTMATIVAGTRDAEIAADRKALQAALAQAELSAAEDRQALVAALQRIERKVGTRSLWSPAAAELRAAAVGALASALAMCLLLEFQARPTAVGIMLAVIATAGGCAAFVWWKAR